MQYGTCEQIKKLSNNLNALYKHFKFGYFLLPSPQVGKHAKENKAISKCQEIDRNL